MRISIIVMVPLLVVCGILYLYWYKSPFICLFYQLTGLYCFGCGAGRASYELVHLRILSAMDYNVVFVVIAPFLVYYLIKQYVYVILGKDVLPFFSIGKWAIKAILVVLISFVIIRNIPLIPFVLLAP